MKKTSKAAVERRASVLHVRGWCRRCATPICVICAMLCGVPRGSAQSKLKTPAERVVQGTVEHDGTVQDHVVVYLQNETTQEIRSYVTNGGGQFHFNQLLPDVDYQVWAEVNKHRSKKHTISMFSSHLKFTYTLKV